MSSSSSMGVKTNSRNLSFQLLSSESSGDAANVPDRSISDSILEDASSRNPPTLSNHKRHRRRRNKGSKRNPGLFQCSPDDNSCQMQKFQPRCIDRSISNPLVLGAETVIGTVIASLGPDDDLQYLQAEHQISGVELRQRAVNGCMSDQPVTEESVVGSRGQQRPETKSVNKLETAGSLDWNHVMADNSDLFSNTDLFQLGTTYTFWSWRGWLLDGPLTVEKMPLKYFIGEIYDGNSLRSTTSLENEKKRQRVYNTMFHVPWRCELLIDVGFFVCLDSFLSLLTIMPARILMTFWRFLNVRQFQRPCAAELSDFGSFIVLACGVTLLQATDISLIYHIIRGQGTIKLYVVYNVLEIFDKLCQSFGGDVLQVLFNSAEGVANCPPENITFELLRFVLDQTIAVIAFIAHSFVLLAQAITLSTCIVAHNNALLALLVSNNFSEIKSNVFKRVSKDNLHSLVYHDTIERFHITAFVLFVLAQNILEAEGPWFGSFLFNALLVYMCEIFIDVIKHSFLAKFNEIKPVAYSEFLEALCRQTLNIQSQDDDGKTLDFIPLAPACVVIRVLTPIYAAHLPHGPLAWRLLWIFILLAMTYIMLATLKIMVGMGLRLHAQWYIKRCLRRRQHLHLD